MIHGTHNWNISWYVGENVSMVTVWKHTHKDDMHVGKKYSTGMEVGEEMEVGTHVPTYPRTHVLTYSRTMAMEKWNFLVLSFHLL